MDGQKKYFCMDLLFAAAVLIVLYPFFACLYNNRRQQMMIVSYDASVSQMTDEDYAEYIAAALAWNQELYTYVEPSYFPDGLTDDEIYEFLLNINGDGMMGYVSIPKISVKLPIYHYATDDVLLKGAGHMAASALPVGGESTRCVITAHRGLPTAEMFTDLDKLEEGDEFYLEVLGDTYAYKVIEIEEIDPSDTATLLPEAGEDLCTLVTCTPYGVNSRRLLVTGERTEYIEGSDDISGSVIADTAQSNRYLLLIAGLEAAAYVYLKRRRKTPERSQHAQGSDGKKEESR